MNGSLGPQKSPPPFPAEVTIGSPPVFAGLGGVGSATQTDTRTTEPPTVADYDISGLRQRQIAGLLFLYNKNKKYFQFN